MIRSLHAAIFFGVLAWTIPAAADAKIHRFAPTDDVRVTLELRHLKGAGALVRFTRNRVAVTSSGSRTLMLRANRARSRRVVITRRRPQRVRVVLSARTGTVSLTAGRKTARLSGRFIAEDAVVVRTRRGVRVLQIRPGDAPAQKSPASPVPAPPGPRPTPSTTPALQARLFASSSVWNAPLAADAPLDPANDVLVKTLRDTVAQNIAARWGPWIGTGGNTPLYVVPGSQPTVRVTLDAGAWATTLQTAFEAVPIPAGAIPAVGPDGHMTVWQPSTDRLWEFFKARKLADGWHADYGGAIKNVSRSVGYYTTDSWPGLSQTYWGATATSLPVVAGTMLIDELKSGVIPHALAMNIPFAKPNVYSWPAQRTDGTSTDPNAIPEGARFRLDPKLDLSKLELPRLTRMMAVAAQRYGLIVRDQTGHAISFFGEDPRQYGSDPYGGPGGFFDGPYPNPVMEAFPWHHLQLLKMDLKSQG